MIETWRCIEEEGGTVIAEGQVTNVSPDDLFGIRVHVRLYGRGRALLDQAESGIDAEPLWPEQTAGFELVLPVHPNMESSSVVFTLPDGRRVHAIPREDYDRDGKTVRGPVGARGLQRD